jgi:ferredoxin-NADP reductase
LLHSEAGSGNAGLVPAAARPVSPGFRPLTVTAVDQESVDVLSLTLESRDREPLPKALPGQYVVLRLQATLGGAPLYRSYSLSGPASTQRYRISVKIEPNGAAGSYLRGHVGLGAVVDVSFPRGSFIIQSAERPVVLLGAGIGATPLLAMLHSLAAARSTRPVLWLYGARDRQHHPFAAEVRRLMLALQNGRSHVCYSRPGSGDQIGVNFDATGHLSQTVLDEVGVPPDADVYLCGPTRFITDMKEALAALGVTPQRIHVEIFGGGEPVTPGVVAGPPRVPHVPESDVAAGPLVTFARSGIAAHWDASAYRSILDLAEACDVPVRWACRAGVCHMCETGLVEGAVAYDPRPLEQPAPGNLLICCSRPSRDVVVDL